jgi:putative ABC transport system substrate-binding protein
MRVIAIAVVLALGIGLAAPLAVEAQQPGKVYRVGILSAGDKPSPPSIFRQSLTDSGYVEGTNLSFVYGWADGDFDRLPALAIALVRPGVDVLVAVSTSSRSRARELIGREV